MKGTKLFTDFFNSEKSSGLVLIACTIFSLLLANSNFGTNYLELFQAQFAKHSLEHWINDGLMTIFFLLIGLELEREIYQGELSNLKDALLPIFGALGGMFVPAGIFLLLNYGTSTQSGAGIPMATDIAFALGILSLLGSRVPISLKVFLTALAVIDDLGAIIIIAIFYTKTLLWTNLFIALGIFFCLLYSTNESKKLDSILNWWNCNVVFYASFRSSRHNYRCFIGFCNSIWQRRRKINFLHFATFFTQTSCIYHFANFCISKYSHRF
jgi:NhaA family Na+:H+ antiporter